MVSRPSDVLSPSGRVRQQGGLLFRTGFAALVAGSPVAGDSLEALDDALEFSAAENTVRVSASGTLDAEFYYFDQPAPGLLYTSDDHLFNPRLTVFLDAQVGSKIYAFLQARLDRGFDPSDGGAEVRLDEWAVRYTPWNDGRLSLQAGIFPTAVGTWSPRAYSWQNPFVTAPVPYENLTGIWDSEVAPTPEVLRAWGHVIPTPWLPNEFADKHLRNPIVWGPAYGTGLAVMGRLGDFEYNAEVKGSSPSARPEDWGAGEAHFDYPTFSGRLGWRPSPMWRFGFSASAGPYLLPKAKPTLPEGSSLDDFLEIILAQDVSFAWRHWQVWAEVFQARFETPFGNADTLAYYLEAKYKFSPQWFAALRFNQHLYDEIRLGTAERAPWGADLWRLDSALGWRPTEHTQIKIQYTFQYEDAAEHDSGHLFATQVTARF